MELIYVTLDRLEPDPAGIREDAGDIDGLAQTIQQQGLLQPLGVTALRGDHYRVVYGSRRLRAVQQLGFEPVPCVLVDAESAEDVLVRQVIENVQRQDLNDIEKARAFHLLRERLTHEADQHDQKLSEGELDEQIGTSVGLAARTIRRYLGLLDLPVEVQQLIKNGELGVTQAQHLRRISAPRTQIELAQMVAEEGLSATQVSNLANYFAANPNLSVETAMQALDNNQELRSTPSEQAADVPSFSHTAPGAVGENDTSDFWADEDDEPQEAIDQDLLDLTAPQPKTRVQRIHSLDQMVDETDRLSRAYHEGDLQKWVQRDDNASFKLRLLLKQLRTLTQALEALVGDEE